MAQKKSKATEDSLGLAVEETKRQDHEENLLIKEAFRQSFEEAREMEEKESTECHHWSTLTTIATAIPSHL